jgi:hypothetical protein
MHTSIAREVTPLLRGYLLLISRPHAVSVWKEVNDVKCWEVTVDIPVD